jgi:hypothetical protein
VATGGSGAGCGCAVATGSIGGVRSAERCEVLGSCLGSVCAAFCGAAGDVVRFAAVARRRSSETAGASRG